MAVERLYIENTYIPLSQGLNPSITKELKNLAEPDKQKASYSKTVSIPRSKEADKIFSHIFEINVLIQGGEFNIQAKADCRYEVDSETIIQGYLKLNQISVNDFQDIVYDCTMYSEVANFFAEIAGNYLTDLYPSAGSYEGLDVYDHPLTKELQAWSWDFEIIKNYPALIPFAYGTGYVYALVDFGYSQNATDFIYTQIAPSIYEKEYMTKIISWAGFTIKAGGFFDTDTWIDHLIIPSSPECYQLTSTDIEGREFAANTPQFTSTGTTTSNNLPKGTFSTPDIIKFTNELFDTGLNYNPATGVFTAIQTGVHDITALIDVNATFTPDSAGSVKCIADIHGFIEMWHTPISTGVAVLIDQLPFYITKYDTTFYIGARSTAVTPTYPPADNDYMSGKAWGKIAQTTPVGRAVNPPDRYQLTATGVPLQASDTITIKWKGGMFAENDGLSVYSSTTTEFFINNVGTKTNGNAVIKVTVGSFYNKVSNLTMTEGNTLQMLDVIPKKIKMIDYFMWNVKRFNLIVDVDPLNPTQLIIETRDNYLGTDVLNIHELIDRSKPIDDFPMELLDAKQYLFTYKKDTDYFNERYTKSWQEIYGQRTCDVTTDFANQVKKTELGFSPTCMVGLPQNDRVLPTIYALNDYNQPVTTKFNIRSLYYAGLKPCANAWNHTNYVSVFGIPLTDSYVTYPYAGHFDDPYAPTLDINFGLVKEVFYDDDLHDIVVTDNNLVNKYHAKQLREMTDPNSRILKCHVHLTPLAYVNFTFDKLYYFDYAYFRLQKIEGYNPTSEETTLCTFFKVNNASAFTPSGHPTTGKPTETNPLQEGGGIGMTETTPAKGVRSSEQPDNNNYSARSIDVKGEFNYISGKAKSVEIYGDSNKVFAEAKNIKIQGDSNLISAGVENVTLINTNGLTITESDVTYIDGKIQGAWVEKITGFLVDDTIYGYYLNGATGAVQARLNNSTSEFFFKCTDATNRVYIDGGTITIDNTATTFDLLENESIRLKYNSQDNTYYIIN